MDVPNTILQNDIISSIAPHVIGKLVTDIDASHNSIANASAVARYLCNDWLIYSGPDLSTQPIRNLIKSSRISLIYWSRSCCCYYYGGCVYLGSDSTHGGLLPTIFLCGILVKLLPPQQLQWLRLQMSIVDVVQKLVHLQS